MTDDITMRSKQASPTLPLAPYNSIVREPKNVMSRPFGLMVKVLINGLLAAGLMLTGAHSLQAAQPAPGERQASFIIQGKAASTAEYPWLASLFVGSATDAESGGACGGALITPNWILTAAHCFLNDAGNAVDHSAGERTTVTLRSDTIDPVAGLAEVYNVKNLIIHSNYNPDQESSPNANDADIALLEIEGTSLQPVMQLLGDSSANLDNIIGTVAGWGKTSNDGESSNSLLQVSLKVTSNSSCNSAYAGGITDNMLCAGGLTAGDISDTCQGDSGGPLFLNQSGRHLQIGVVSFGGTETGPACGDPDAPGVYARVSRFKGFILETLPDVQFVDLQISDTGTPRFGTLPVIGGYSSAKQLSTARFAGGLTRDNGQTFESRATTSDFVRILGQITPEAGDVGRTSDIFVVDRKDGVFL